MLQNLVQIFLENPFGQTMGVLGMFSVIYAFLQKDDSKVVKVLCVSCIFWGLHFFFLELYVALASVLVGIFRLTLSLKYKKNLKIFYLIIFVTISLGILTYEDNSSILPILASLFSSYGFFFLERIKLRLLLLVCSILWFSYGYINFSIGGVINETIIQFVHVYTIYKIIESEGTKQYYIEKIRTILTKKRKIDYGRYLAIMDYIKIKNKSWRNIK